MDIYFVGSRGFLGSHLCKRFSERNCVKRFTGSQAAINHPLETIGSLTDFLAISRFNEDSILVLAGNSFFSDDVTGELVNEMWKYNFVVQKQFVDHFFRGGGVFVIYFSSAIELIDAKCWGRYSSYAESKKAFSSYMLFRYPHNSLGVVLFDNFGSGDRRGKLITSLRNTKYSRIPLTITEPFRLIDLLPVSWQVDVVVSAARSGTVGYGVLASLRPLLISEISEIGAMYGCRSVVRNRFDRTYPVCYGNADVLGSIRGSVLEQLHRFFDNDDR